MYKIFRTGNIFIDIGLIRLHELIPSNLNRNYLSISENEFSCICKKYLKKLDEKKQENILTSNSRVQNILKIISDLEKKIASEKNQNKKDKLQQQLDKKLKQLEKQQANKEKRESQSYASLVKAFLNNNAMFGQPTTIDDELFAMNLNLLVKNAQDTLENKLANDVQEKRCDFCFNFKAPMKTSFFKRDRKSKKIVMVEKDREITNAIYPLLGAEAGGSGLNSFFPDGRSNLHMCYVCELLTFINSCNPPKYVAYVPDLVIMKRLDELLQFKEKISDKVYEELLRFNFAGIKVIEFEYDNGVSINNYGVFSPDVFKKYIRANDVLKDFSFVSVEVRKQLDNYLLNSNYTLVRKQLLGQLIASSDENKNIKNLRCFNKFLKEVLEMKGKDIEHEFKNAAQEISDELDADKTKSICLRMLSLLRSNNREELRNIIFELCINNSVPLPKNINNIIIESPEDDMSYAVGIFIENLYKGGGKNE